MSFCWTGEGCKESLLKEITKAAQRTFSLVAFVQGSRFKEQASVEIRADESQLELSN